MATIEALKSDLTLLWKLSGTRKKLFITALNDHHFLFTDMIPEEITQDEYTDLRKKKTPEKDFSKLYIPDIDPDSRLYLLHFMGKAGHDALRKFRQDRKDWLKNVVLTSDTDNATNAVSDPAMPQQTNLQARSESPEERILRIRACIERDFPPEYQKWGI